MEISTINGLYSWNQYNGLPWLPGNDTLQDYTHSQANILSLFNNTLGASRILLRFNNLSSAVPPGAAIVSARLHLTFRYVLRAVFLYALCARDRIASYAPTAGSSPLASS